MKRILFTLIPVMVLMSTIISGTVTAQEIKDISLPKPDRSGGKPMMQCLNERSTSREFSSKELTLMEISNLLWAANGINREESGRHTSPTAMNHQNMEVYVIMPGGVFFYDDKANLLKLIQAGNHMKAAGKQDFVERAPLNVIVVSDMSKLGDSSEDQKLLYAGIHAGAIIQNIYLYCASAGLNTVVRAYFDQEELAGALMLSPEKKVILAQTVGRR